MKSKVWMYAGASLLMLAFGLGVGKPITSLIVGCGNDEYFDDVDKVCVQGGRVEIMNGRSQWEILDIMWRRGQELMKIRGVTNVGVDRHGIRVEGDPDHDPIPADMEGAPIHVMPSRDQTRVNLSHTQSEKIRPYGAGTLTTDTNWQTANAIPTGTGGPISK